MSLLDGPFWILSRADEALTAFPGALRLMFWAALAAILSMELYRVLSPQARLRATKAELRGLQSQVAAFDGEFSDGWPLVRRMLKAALQRVWLVLPATLAASLPLLVLILWLASAYGSAYPPPGSAVDVRVPTPLAGRWVEPDLANPKPQVEIGTAAGESLLKAPLEAPAPIIAKWRWWNAFLGNPAGYLPDNAPVEEVEIALPRQEYLSAGPQWARGWEIVFLPSLLVAALLYKRVRRVE